MYIRIIYPSTLIAIGGTALCLEQKNWVRKRNGAGEAIWDEGTNHSQINEETSSVLADFFSLRVGLQRSVRHIFHFLIPIRELFREL
jgi:hypothetical protein